MKIKRIDVEKCSCGSIYFRQCIDGILKREQNRIPGNVREYIERTKYNYICVKCGIPLGDD